MPDSRSRDTGLDATMQAPAGGATARARDAGVAQTLVQNTVLPRVEVVDAAAQLVPVQRARYEQLDILGEGGVGQVALVQDHDIGRTVALKRLRPEVQANSNVMRFIQEVRIVGQLEHPNIVPVHDVGVDAEGQFFFVMKRVQGETLAAIIEKLAAGDPAYTQRFTLEARVMVFLGILRAIQYAHAQGVIHRDLKPANVMVGPFGEVHVMDWGLAKRLRDPVDKALEQTRAGIPGPGQSRAEALKTQQGALLGTPAYMSPEQARGDVDAVDERSDVFALCVILHELLALRHYLEDESSLGAVLAGVLSPTLPARIEMDALHRDRVPSEIGWVIQRGMARDPAERYPSVDALLAAMQSVIEGRAHVVCSVTFYKRMFNTAIRAADRWPRGVVFGTGAACALGVVSTVYMLVNLLS